MTKTFSSLTGPSYWTTRDHTKTCDITDLMTPRSNTMRTTSSVGAQLPQRIVGVDSVQSYDSVSAILSVSSHSCQSCASMRPCVQFIDQLCPVTSSYEGMLCHTLVDHAVWRRCDVTHES